MACKHKDWWVLIAQEKKGVLVSPYNYKDGHKKQTISAWCEKCGALKISGRWVKPTGVE